MTLTPQRRRTLCRRSIAHIRSGRELSHLFSAFASASSMESIALKATVVMPILLLQRPHSPSKTKEHVACSERRLRTWNEGNLNELRLEGKTIQNRFSKFDMPKVKENKYISLLLKPHVCWKDKSSLRPFVSLREGRYSSPRQSFGSH